MKGIYWLMRITKITVIASALALSGLLSSARADDVIRRDSHRDLDRAAASISKEARRMRVENDALHTVSVETGVPAPKTHQMLDRWSDAGVGGVMIACTIADYTKRDPNYYMERRFHDHQPWDKIIADTGVPFEKVDRKLAKLDDYVHASADHRR